MNIVFEGADGCGKDAVANAVALKLAEGCQVRRMNFPDDNEPVTGPMIRAYLRREWSVTGPWGDHGGTALQALMTANRLARLDHLKDREYMRSAHNVICRYWQSAWVYGQLDGLDGPWLEAIHQFMPRATHFLLTASAETCMARRAARDGSLPPERYEGKLAMTQRVVALYEDLWYNRPNKDGWWVIDAEKPLGQVVEDVLGVIHV